MLSSRVLTCRLLVCLRGAVLTSVVLAAGLARAQTPSPADGAPPDVAVAPPRPVDVEVDRHAALGQRLLERGHTQEAIAEFRRAYELRADPRFLSDIAGGYRQLGLREQARFFYERYLAAAPDAPDRDEVEAALAALGHAPTPTPTPSLARDVVIVPVSVPEPPAREGPPLWRRWWVWTAFGALVAAGVVSVLLTRQSDTEVPATALGDKRFY